MNCGDNITNSPTHLQGDLFANELTNDSTMAESSQQQNDPFALIDLAAPNSNQDDRNASKSVDPSVGSKSFAEDLGVLQPTPVCMSKSGPDKKEYAEPSSLLHSHTRSLRRTKRAGNRFDDLPFNRCSTPESIVSEIQRAQAIIEPISVDPYTQWYQLMQNYYKRFYPSYEFGISPANYRTSRGQRHLPISAVPLTQPAAPQQQPPSNLPGWPPFPIQGRPVTSGAQIPNPLPQMQMPGFGKFPEYAAYYYQYYMGAWAAANGWPVPAGRTTPKVFIEPHIRATLATPGLLIQILPNRPQDSEPGRIELLDISQLASDVVAEITNRLSAVSMTSRGTKTGVPRHFSSQQHFPNSYTTTASDANMASSANDDLDSRFADDDLIDAEEEEEEYIDLVNAWDRTDHVLYPGPLSQGTTLKHDVQAFLRGKVEDIQDRMPVDWDSAGLLLSYLELLVKNNGIVHPGDVVNLLMGNDSGRLTYDYPTSNPISSVAPIPSFGNRVMRQSSFNINAIGGGSGGLYLETNSGRESPRVTLNHSASIGGFQQMQQSGSGRSSVAGSSTGGMSISRLMRKGLLAEFGSAQERETAALHRFRELLMHGHPMKALDQACQSQLWGHAFALAMRLGSGPLDRVMEKFLSRAVNSADPLLTLYQLTAGEIPRSVDQLAYASGTDTGDWRPHLAMLLSAPEGHGDLVRDSLERMGESLLARRLLFAAHLCFLLATTYSSNQDTIAPSHLHPRIWLLGVSSPITKSSETSSGRFVITTDVERASTEAIQLTEIYEFTLALATRNKHFFLPGFLPFKFAYCLRLLDAGFVEKAFRYLEVLSDSISTLYEQEIEGSNMTPSDLRSLFLIASQCLRLSERLQHHPEVSIFEMEGSSHDDGFRGGFSAPCPRWMGRLKSVYYRVASMLGLPNADRPYVDPLCVSSSQEPPAKEVQQEKMIPRQEQVPQPTQVQTAVASTIQKQQPSASSWNTQKLENQQTLSGQTANQFSQSSHIVHQSPPLPPPEVQQQPNRVPTTQNPTLSRPQPQFQPAIHESVPSLPQPSTPTFYQEQQQQQKRPSYGTLNVSPLNQQPQQNQLLDKSLPPTPVVGNQKSPIGAPSTNPGFFVPTFNPATASSIEPDSQAASSVGYDYFAGLAASPSLPRSRTVSMASSQGDSTSHPSAPSPTNSASAASVLPPIQVQQRPGGVEQPQQPSVSSSRNSGNFLRDSRARNAQNDARFSHPSPFTAAPPQPKLPTDDGQKSIEHPQKSQSVKHEKEQKPDGGGGQSGKSGWFSGLLGRIKGGQEIFLPDDSNPSIIWDEATGRWRDKMGGEQEEDVPPPPPQIPAVHAVHQNTSTPASNSVPLHVLATGGSRGGTSTRSRYVNVLAKEGVSSGPKAVNLAPPLPSTFLPST